MVKTAVERAFKSRDSTLDAAGVRAALDLNATDYTVMQEREQSLSLPP